MSQAPRYPKHVFWSDEDKGFIAVASDLPGASAFGETEAEALAELHQAIDAWIEAARAAGNAVPAPSRPASASRPSGKVLVRMPKGLHQRAAVCAEREAVSLNQFIVACVAEAVGERSRASEPVPQIGSEPGHLLHEISLWFQQNLSSTALHSTEYITAVVSSMAGHLTTGHAVVYGAGVHGIDEWYTTQTSMHFDPIEATARVKQDSIWKLVGEKVKSGSLDARG